MKRILQNSFSKTILCLLVALLSGGTAWAQVAYRTIDFANCDRSRYATNHGTTWTATNTSENFRVTLTSFNNAANANSGYWDYIACGRAWSLLYDRSVVATITTGLIDKPITQIDLTISQLSSSYADNVNSITLETSSDYTTWNPAGTFAIGAGKQSVTLSTPTANLFYRIVVDCDESSAFLDAGQDNFVQISKVVFNKAADDPNAVPAPTITGNPQPTFPTQTLVTISRPDGVNSVLYSLDGGATWQTYTSALTLTKTTTVMAKAIRGNKESEVVSKCFSHADDVVECTWNLKAAPTGGTPTANQALWTDDAEGNHTGAVMTLEKGGSSTNVTAHIGNNNDGTYFYSGQNLTVGPVEGYTITSVEFTCGSTAYATALEGCGWSNATVTRAGTKVTVTPIDGTQPIYMVVTAETHVTSVTVHYSPTEQPHIEVAEHELNVSSASAEGTIELEYHGGLSPNNVTVEVSGENSDWISSVSIVDGNVSYRIDANTTTANRTARIRVMSKNTDDYITVTQAAAYVLADGTGADNTTLISEHNGEKCSAVLSGRTFAKNKWYTLCLPFDVDLNAEGCPLAGADARMLNDQTHIEGHTLKLEFTNVSELVAGTPYIIRWTSGDFETISSPAFADVTISSVTNDTKFTLDGGRTITFMGTYKFTKYGAVDQSILFISSNTIYYVGENTTIGAQRGYFKLGGFIYNGTGSTSTGVKEFGITLLDEDPTGIDEFKFEENSNDAIYNLSGQRMGKMQKGINIVNGKKIMVK